MCCGGLRGTGPKLGYINSQEILVNTPGAEAARLRSDAEMSGYQNEIVQLETELQNLEAALQQQQLTLSPEARANREQQLQAKFQEYQQRTGQLPGGCKSTPSGSHPTGNGQHNICHRRLRRRILLPDLDAPRIDHSADPALDLTQEVITRLQAAADPGLGPSE